MYASLVDFSRAVPRQMRRLNPILLLLVAGLCLTGVAFIFGTGQQTGGYMAGYWLRQVVFCLLGAGLMLGLASLDYHLLDRHAPAIYLLSLGALVVVLLFGTTINGARSWLNLGVTKVQPSEAAKLGAIVALASLFAHPARSADRFRYVAVAVGLTVLPVVLIGMQPDYGSALVLLPVLLAVLFVAGFRTRWLVYLGVLGALSAPLVYEAGLSKHQRERLGVFLDPVATPVLALSSLPEPVKHKIRDHLYLTPDPTGRGWNARQSLLAVGSGGVLGKGFMNGTQNTLGFLPRPVAPTDFIFSVVAEETGFVGGVVLIMAFGGLLFTALFVAAKAADDFGRYLAVGVAALVAVHVFINMGMTIGLMPIIGLPLPFISYGGSFMLVMMASMGILQSVYIRRNRF